jgi:hypothetical protein
MIAYTVLAYAATTLLSLATAAPNSIPPTGIVHHYRGQHYRKQRTPLRAANVVGEIGDLIEFHFHPKNHTVVQSYVDKPCDPLANGSGFFSGFDFAILSGEADNVMRLLVENRQPFWYYCSQNVGSHCQKGMNDVINQNLDGDKRLAPYKEQLLRTYWSTSVVAF